MIVDALLRDKRRREGDDLSLPPAAVRALGWTRDNEARRGGIRVHSGRRDAYPEVTGYFIPTLLEYGETELAARCIRWLLRIQRPDGGYASAGGVPHVFDTGQALRGLLAGASLSPPSREAARRAAEYLCAQIVDGGREGFGKRYMDRIPETIHLYVLPPLRQAAEIFHDDRYREAADRCLEFYLAHEEALRLDDLTHFLAYELEALLDLGRTQPALAVLEALRNRQAADGSIAGREGVTWVCAPGLAQLALCWYKLGEREPADRAMAWLEAHQRPSGGFLGSYGPGATYFPNVELSWAAKFYLDAVAWRRTERSGGRPGTTSPGTGMPSAEDME